MAKISIIIPVWNGANYLAEAIESVLEQDYANKEVVIVNDGSTDETAQIIARYANHVRAITQKNKGLGASRNLGAKLATGQYFSFLDHDDLWLKTKLSEQYACMQQHATTDPLLFSHVEQFLCPSLTSDQKSKIALAKNILPGFVAGTILMSRTRFFQVGEFRETKEVGEFIDWYQRALEQKIPIVLLDSITMRRRLHLSNMGRQHHGQRTDYLKILKAGLNRRRQTEGRL